MSRAVVVDASALVAALLDGDAAGQWVTESLSGARLLAPSLLVFEASNIIRRHELARLIGADQAAQAHADLLDLPVEQWPYELLGRRVWELRRPCRATTPATLPSPNSQMHRW